jgi:hypothetical protein
MDAARRQRGHKVADDRQNILDALRKCGPLTDEELLGICEEMNPNAIRARRGSLVVDMLIMPSSTRRPTRSGGTACAWVLTEAGRAVAR